MEALLQIYAGISVGFTAPILQWIGRHIPGDVPALSWALSIAFNTGVVYGLKTLLAVPMEPLVMWGIISGGVVASGGVHAIGKTMEKNGVNTLGLFAPKAPGDHSN